MVLWKRVIYHGIIFGCLLKLAKRGQEKIFIKTRSIPFSMVCIRLLDKYGFTPQMIGMKKYVNDLENIDVVKKQIQLKG